MPGWQALRNELNPKGLEVVTVGLDGTGGVDARPPIEAAAQEHPSLIDATHVVDERFGVQNVPAGIWIDEEGVIVRPPETAAPAPLDLSGLAALELPPRLETMFGEAAKIRMEPEAYVTALRDWVERGSESRYALSPDEVVSRSRPRSGEDAGAAAHFELAQHLHAGGRTEAAVIHFREAHRLDPENWTYRRQAWLFASPVGGPLNNFWQGPLPGHEEEWPYEGDFLTNIMKVGAENYYPPLDL